MTRLDAGDIQGNILHGYSRLQHALLLLARVDDPAKARAWLRALRVTAEGDGKPERQALNLAFTFHGLRVLGAPERLLRPFPEDFGQGMRPRSARLGDEGANAPKHWEEAYRDDVDVLVMLRGSEEEACDAALRELAPADGLDVVARERSRPLDPGKPVDQREHFGFADGFAQPVIEGVSDPDDEPKHRPLAWSGVPTDGRARRRSGSRWRVVRGPAWRPVKAGEFLLGHEDEDGVVPGSAPFYRNGSFMVLRKLEQRPAAFREALRRNALELIAATGEQPSAENRRKWEAWAAAKIVGRWYNGAPLVHHPRSEPSDSGREDRNEFGYLQADPRGARCPLGAHIRRTNPRDALVGGEVRTRRHRMVRRGLPYGARLPEDQPDDGSRGLLFMCFVASIARQFETVQGWCADGNLFDVPGEPDLLLGGEQHATMTAQAEGSLPRFLSRTEPLVVTRGGAYFFYPSVSAVEAIARGDYSGQDARL